MFLCFVEIFWWFGWFDVDEVGDVVVYVVFEVVFVEIYFLWCGFV